MHVLLLLARLGIWLASCMHVYQLHRFVEIMGFYIKPVQIIFTYRLEQKDCLHNDLFFT